MSKYITQCLEGCYISLPSCLPSFLTVFFLLHLYILFSLNNCLVQAPISLCSPECSAGQVKNQIGIHKCCFYCEICPSGTYINSTGKLLYKRRKSAKAVLSFCYLFLDFCQGFLWLRAFNSYFLLTGYSWTRLS